VLFIRVFFAGYWSGIFVPDPDPVIQNYMKKVGPFVPIPEQNRFCYYKLMDYKYLN
jgi:hypothetical protein